MAVGINYNKKKVYFKFLMKQIIIDRMPFWVFCGFLGSGGHLRFWIISNCRRLSGGVLSAVLQHFSAVGRFDANTGPWLSTWQRLSYSHSSGRIYGAIRFACGHKRPIATSDAARSNLGAFLFTHNEQIEIESAPLDGAGGGKRTKAEKMRTAS